MSNANHLGVAISEIARARELVAQLRAENGGGNAAVVGQLEQALSTAFESANSAAGLMRQQSQRLTELSAMVVGATGRHF